MFKKYSGSKSYCSWQHGPCNAYVVESENYLYQVTDPNDWNNSTEKGSWIDPNRPASNNKRLGRPLKANHGVWPPVKTPEKAPANNGKPLKQGTTFTLEKKNGICLPLTEGTYVN